MTGRQLRVLIGTPIHQVKDYSMERWLENVSKLEYPADLLMVDNSPGFEYLGKVKGYCAKYGITNYKLRHIEVPDKPGSKVLGDKDEAIHERVARSREVARKEVLDGGYDVWFSWECDQIIPTDTLGKLIDIMQEGDFMMVNHNCWNRDVPGNTNTDFGVSLASRRCLEKYSFIPDFGSPEAPDSWYDGEAWYRRRLIKDGQNFVEVYGVAEPIYHLDN